MGSSQATGRCTITLDAVPIRSQPGATLQPGGINRKGDTTDQGEFWYTESFIPATIKATMPHMSDVDVIKLRKWRDGTATFETDAGHSYTVAKACITEVGDIGDGKVQVTIMGAPVK